jgi:uncharacterized protein (DUF983 family)
MRVYTDNPADLPPALEKPRRPWRPAIWRGLRMLCPACGKGGLFRRYLKVVDRCPVCGEELHHHRADDAPPYFTMLLVAHIVVPLMIIVENVWHPALWVHFSMWLPLVIALSLMLLPLVKGGIVGLQWALCLHGFEFAAQCRPADPGRA